MVSIVYSKTDGFAYGFFKTETHATDTEKTSILTISPFSSDHFQLTTNGSVLTKLLQILSVIRVVIEGSVDEKSRQDVRATRNGGLRTSHEVDMSSYLPTS